MADERNDQADALPPSANELDRRSFIQGVGAAGVLGGLGLSGLGATPAEAQAAQAAQQAGGNDVPRPATLRAGAQVDSRWPVTYRETIPQGIRLVTQYFAALSEQNLQGIADVLHFPFAIFEQTEPIVFRTAQDFLANPPMTLAPAGRKVNHPGHYTGAIAPGSYNLFQSIDVPLFCPVGAVVAFSFMRYSEAGYKLFDCEGIYTVTNNDGRWGIELISTITKPTDHLGAPQLDAELSAVRDGQDGMLRYTNRHVPATGPDEEEPVAPGRRASVSFGYGPRQRARDARNNDPTLGWRIRGVTSRLSVTEPSAGGGGPQGTPDPDPNYPQFARTYNFAQFAGWAGGNVGPWGDTWTNPYTPRILGHGRHADRQKAHTMGGYIRHTPDLTMISETRSVSIRVYRGGQWGSAGGIGQVTYHDRSNSYPTVEP